METEVLVVLQDEGSPLKGMLDESLAGCSAQALRVRPGEPLPGLAASPACLVAWDLSGWQAGPAREVRVELEQGLAGVMLLAAEPDALFMKTAKSPAVRGQAVAPRGAHEMALALELARANQRRICGLLTQVEDLRRQHEERKIIEQAKRTLIREKNLGEAEAMRRMQKYCRSRNLRMAELARRILAGWEFVNGNNAKA